MLRLARLLVVVLALAGCEEPLRVPYIEPDLANWPQPYRGVDGLVLHRFETGILRVPEALLRQGGSPSAMRRLAVASFVVEHPQQGLVVIGSGLPDRPVAVAPPGGGMLAALMAGEARPSRTLAAQMADAGLALDQVRWVLLPTLLPQHAGSVESFPEATVVVSRTEHRHAMRAPTVYRLDDFDDVANWKTLEFAGAGAGVGTFREAIDLFGDGSVLAVEASGWTAGAMVFLVRMAERPVLLAGGLAEVREHARYAAKPVAIHDLGSWWQHIWELKRFADLAPELLVVPGSEPGGLASMESTAVVEHEAPAVDEADPTPTPDTLRRLLP